ncbi:MAG: 3-ketoacyl-ACP reductase [Chloroflexi bacterium]|nr:3-ketoacyl-ACP reductase [Chloroflexota bacterium]MCL5275383.1 3-ketoacyl-ACP reductase [Chloroflexota bacterium]
MSEAIKRESRRVAVVTGASRGIGRAIAVALAGQGWAVAINYQSNATAAADTLAQVQAAGGTGLLVQADIAGAADRERLLRETLAGFGRLDLLVNNAGMAPRQRVDMLQMSEASYDEVMAVNLKGPFFLTQAAAGIMIKLRAAGTIDNPMIVNIGSMSAYTSSTNRAEYCLSKAGMGMMTALYADRLAEYGINVYEVRPGIVDTDMTGAARSKYDKRIAEGLIPISRWGQPEDVGRAVAAIAAGALPYSTGEVINVDGGIHLQRL